MAIGVDTIKTTGRLIFELERDEEKTTRAIEVPAPNTNTEGDTIQNAVNAINTNFTNAENQMNVFIQPANWRDTNVAELQWTTTRVYYEIVTTMTRPVEPDTE